MLHCGRREVHDAFVVVGATGDEGATTWVFDVHKVIFFFRSLMAANARRKDFTFDFARDEDDTMLEMLISDASKGSLVTQKKRVTFIASLM